MMEPSFFGSSNKFETLIFAEARLWLKIFERVDSLVVGRYIITYHILANNVHSEIIFALL